MGLKLDFVNSTNRVLEHSETNSTKQYFWILHYQK